MQNSNLTPEQVKKIKAKFEQDFKLKHNAILGHVSTLMSLAREAGIEDYVTIQRNISQLI